MAHDKHLADRIRELPVGGPPVTEPTTCGGLAFLVGSKVAPATGAER